MVEITDPRSCITRIQIRHRLDLENVEHFRDRFNRLLGCGGRIMLVFESSAFVDVRGLWAVAGLVDRARAQNGERSVALVSRSRAVDQLIRMTRLDRHVGVFDRRAEAEAWLAKPHSPEK